ncbi:MAG: PEP-CTERM sorting domain-containing protein [Verrucomicrobiia bacterium]
MSINTSSQQGMYSWTVEGQQQLAQQWFWYRIGSSGGESSIDTISAPVNNLLSGNILQSTYANSTLSASILYSLVGGSPTSGASDLSETISIQNLSGASLSFHFFQYADFNLGNTPNNDSAQLTDLGRNYGGVIQYNGRGCQVSENVDTVVSHPANHAQVGNGSTILNSLNNNTPTTFNDNTATTGNINWGLEWDVNIAAGGTLIISKDLNMQGVTPGSVPEPSTWAFVLLGVLSFGCCRYRLIRQTS